MPIDAHNIPNPHISLADFTYLPCSQMMDKRKNRIVAAKHMVFETVEDKEEGLREFWLHVACQNHPYITQAWDYVPFRSAATVCFHTLREPPCALLLLRWCLLSLLPLPSPPFCSVPPFRGRPVPHSPPPLLTASLSRLLPSRSPPFLLIYLPILHFPKSFFL